MSITHRIAKLSEDIQEITAQLPMKRLKINKNLNSAYRMLSGAIPFGNNQKILEGLFRVVESARAAAEEMNMPETAAQIKHSYRKMLQERLPGSVTDRVKTGLKAIEDGISQVIAAKDNYERGARGLYSITMGAGVLCDEMGAPSAGSAFERASQVARTAQ